MLRRIQTAFMYQAHAYGLGIESEIPLPELAHGCNAVHVRISVGRLSASPPFGPHSVYCDLRRLGSAVFLIEGGHSIIIDPLPEAEGQIVRLHLITVAFNALLRQRRFLVLHGSALVRDGHAVAFLGASHSGKSTLAGLFLNRGYRLLSDDMVAVAWADKKAEPHVLPGVPQVKLWPDSAMALGQDPERLRRLNPLLEKRHWEVSPLFADQPVPLGHIYSLSPAPSLESRRLDPQSAVRELIRHTARIAFLPLADAAAHLRQCATLVRQVPISGLSVPRSFESLPAVADLIDGSFLSKSYQVADPVTGSS
jgi:hypothetical protein